MSLTFEGGLTDWLDKKLMHLERYM